MTTIEVLDGTRIGPFRQGIVDVYRQAFGGDPYYEEEEQVQRFAGDTLPRHAERGAFRCVVALDAGRAVVGFAYGYVGGPGQWWYDTVASRLGPERLRVWARDYFEFVELAVSTPARRRGIGGALHDALLEGLPHRTALLSTWQQETPARRLYRARGWTPLLEDVLLPGATAPIVVMGRPLDRR